MKRGLIGWLNYKPVYWTDEGAAIERDYQGLVDPDPQEDAIIALYFIGQLLNKLKTRIELHDISEGESVLMLGNAVHGLTQASQVLGWQRRNNEVTGENHLYPTQKPLKQQTKIRIDKRGGLTVTTTIPNLIAYLEQRPEFSITERKKFTGGKTAEITGTFPPGKLKELARWIEGG